MAVAFVFASGRGGGLLGEIGGAPLGGPGGAFVTNLGLGGGLFGDFGGGDPAGRPGGLWKLSKLRNVIGGFYGGFGLWRYLFRGFLFWDCWLSLPLRRSFSF